MNESDFVDFEWDEAKADANEAKHGVDFVEASSVFDDPYGRIIDDPDHSDFEERFIIIGLSSKARELTVCHCLRSDGQTIRIISARKATRGEQEQYWRFRR